MNWIKRNWLSLLAVILSITALVRCEPIELTNTSLGWAIGMSVSVMSLGIVIVLGYQIYNAATLDKRMQEMFDEKTKEVRDDIAASGARSDSSILYKIKGVELNLYIATNNHNLMINTLNSMVKDAIIMNQQEIFSDAARCIIHVYSVINQQAPTFLQSGVCHYLLEDSLAVQSRLLSADYYAQPLTFLINKLKDSLEDRKKECPRDGKEKEV